MPSPMKRSLLLALSCVVIAAARPALPTGKTAPTVIAMKPKPYWSWDRIPTSMHGADKDRKYNATEVARLAKYQMYTAEKWYTPCGSKGPTQAGPGCAIESVTEDLYSQVRLWLLLPPLPPPLLTLLGQIKAINPNVTTILYWNSMFDFSFYTAHQHMLDLEAAGVHAFLRDETGKVWLLLLELMLMLVLALALVLSPSASRC